MVGMICRTCRERHHEQCRGDSWCDCQHQPAPGASRDDRPVNDDDAASPGASPAAAPTGPRAEPPVNWRRQG